MKNTVLALTASIIATLFILIGLFAVSFTMHYDMFFTFWAAPWTPSVLGWILIIIPCALTVLAFILASREQMGLSYGVAAIAGAFLAILMDMLIFMDVIMASP